MTRDAREIEREGMLSDMETLRAEKRDLHAEIERLIETQMRKDAEAREQIQAKDAEVERLRREIGILKALLAQYEKP